MAVSLMSAGCTDLILARHRDDAFVDAYRYVLGEQYTTVDGLRVCYQEQGEGEPLIILPGLATSIDFWQLNIPELSRQHHVMALDPPGFGKSDKPDLPYDLSWVSDQIVAFMDDRGVSRASFIGGSMGGQLAMLIALRHPQRVDKLVLMGSSGAWPEPGPLLGAALWTFWNDALITDHLRRAWADIFPKMFLHATPVTERLFHYQMALRADSRRYWPEARACSRALRSIFFHSCRPHLGEIERPVLLIWGEHDHIHPQADALALRRGLPDARLVIVPDAGHEVMVDQADRFNELVLVFLREGTAAISDAYPVEEAR